MALQWVRMKLTEVISNNIDLTGTLTVCIRGDGHGAGGVEEVPQQDLHE